MDEELKTALLERYKKLCERIDELREQGELEAAEQAAGEMKMVLDILLRGGEAKDGVK